MARNFAVTDHLNLGDITIFDGLTAFTIAYWIRLDTTTADARFVGKGGVNAATQSILTTVDGTTNQLRFLISDGTDRLLKDTPNNTLVTGVWAHCGFVWSGGTTMVIYKDGVAQSLTTILGGSPTSVNSTARLFRIGADEDTNGLDGDVAEVAGWDRALSANEVKSIFNRNVLSVSSGLILYSPVIGEAPEPDYGGNALSATVTGTTIADHPPVAPPFGVDMGWQGAFTTVVSGVDIRRQVISAYMMVNA